MERQEIIKEVSRICQHGKNVINPYTGQLMYVPCGQCDTCLHRLTTQRELKCQVQQFISKHCYFLTLTYDQYSIPKARIEHVKDNTYRYYSLPRLQPYKIIKKGKKRVKRYIRGLALKESFEEFFQSEPQYVQDFINKTDATINGKYPRMKDMVFWLSRGDVSLFMKRLRYRIYKNYGKYEKLHSYIVAEYGPVHFRPHYHILLFFESDEIAKNFGSFVRSCWPFGRVDYSSARKDAASYVAAYTNSVTRCPYHLRYSKFTRPFSRFSSHFGREFFKKSIEAAKQGRYDDFISGVPFVENGDLLTVTPWRSVVDSVFFRPLNNSAISIHESINIIRQGLSVFERTTGYLPYDERGRIMPVCRALYNRIFKRMDSLHRHVRFFAIDPYNECILDYWDKQISDVLYYCRVNESESIFPDFEESFLNRLYRFFHTILIFVKEYGITNNTPYSTLSRLLENSRDYWRKLDYERLKEQLSFLEECKQDLTDVILHPNEFTFVNNNTENENPIFKEARQMAKNAVEQTIKHREINDVNIPFVTNSMTYGKLL